MNLRCHIHMCCQAEGVGVSSGNNSLWVDCESGSFNVIGGDLWKVSV